MNIPHSQVTQALQEAAEKEILPRYRNLRAEDISDKGKGEMVTAADHACEAFLAENLPPLLPDSLLIGEESVAANPEQLQVLQGDQPVWVVDPLDGTRNFASGDGPFAIMACLIHRGETLAAWIHSPLENTTVSADRGGGSFRGHGRLPVSDPGGKLEDLRGALLTKFLPPELQPRAIAAADDFHETTATLCAGHDYPSLVDNQLQFLSYYRTLVWDHAPGTLIASEAGATVARYDGTPYQPGDDGKGLLCACDPDTWNLVRDHLYPGVTS